MALESIIRIEAGIDWLTLVQTPREVNSELLEAGKTLVAKEAATGARTRRARVSGFDGLAAGHAAWGVRRDATLVRVSGAVAGRTWARLVPLATRVTRLDQQVTVQLERPHVGLARDAYRDALQAPRKRGRCGVSMLVQSSSGGVTCSVGSRSSERYGRLYDKGIEEATDPPGLRWRWELEAKGDMARRYLLGLTSHERSANAIASNVFSFFLSKGVSACPQFSFTAVPAPLSSRPCKRELAWLATQIRPTVQRLVNAGLRDQVLTALGLLTDEGPTACEPAATHPSSEDAPCHRAISTV